jgi:hypothetical protein
MSTSETIEFPVGARRAARATCPWSGADIFHYIDCRECAGIWRIEYGAFVKTSTEADYNEATQRERVSREHLHDLVSSLVNKYFEEFAAKTGKAEHEEMVRLGITSINYRAFLKRKNEGNSPAQLTDALNNLDWLADLARAASMDEELNRRRAAREHADAGFRSTPLRFQKSRSSQPNSLGNGDLPSPNC